MMLTDLLTNQNQPPTPLRKPAFNISLSSGGSTGGLAALTDTVSALVGASASDSWSDYTQSIKIECGCAPFVDQVNIQLAAGHLSPVLSLADEGSVSLGYSDTETSTVFSGKVSILKELVHGGRRVILGNAAQTLAQQRVNRSFQQTTAADIVQQLLATAGVEAGSISHNGIKIPLYVADDRRSVYQHIARLADWSGHIAYIDVENSLHWVEINTAQAVQTFVYGDDLISIEKQEVATCNTVRRWQGEGAAGSKGSNAWHWLSKTANSLSTGGNASDASINYQGAFRNKDAVDQAATGFTTLPQCQPMRLRLLTSGAAAVTVGSTVAVSDTPEGKLDAEGVVVQLIHMLNKTQGFTTQIELITLSNSNQSTPDLSLGGLL